MSATSENAVRQLNYFDACASCHTHQNYPHTKKCISSVPFFIPFMNLMYKMSRNNSKPLYCAKGQTSNWAVLKMYN